MTPDFEVTWFDDGVESSNSDPTQRVQILPLIMDSGGAISTLMFSPLAASDAGTWTCRVIIRENLMIIHNNISTSISITVESKWLSISFHLLKYNNNIIINFRSID